jgi:transposase
MLTLAEQLAAYKQHFPHLQAGEAKRTDMTTEPKKNRTTLETKEKILELHRLGYNGTQIDQKLNLGQGVAMYHINKMRKRVSTRNGKEKLTEEQEQEIVRLFNKGETLKAIAKKFNVHFTTPGRVLKRLGISTGYLAPKDRKKQKTPTTAPVITTVTTTDALNTIHEETILLKLEIEMLRTQNQILMKRLEIAERKTK